MKCLFLDSYFVNCFKICYKLKLLYSYGHIIMAVLKIL